MTSPPRIVLAAHRLMLRTATTPLGRLWSLLYRLVTRAWVSYLTRGEPGAARYERAGSGVGDVLPGLSDIDVAIVLQPDPVGAGIAEGRTRERWQRLRRRVPSADLLFDYPRIYEEAQLRHAVGASALTYGLDGRDTNRADDAIPYLTDPGPDMVRTLERPGLYGITDDWRLLRGPERRPVEPPLDAQQRRLAAWLELAYCWRWAFIVCTSEPGPRTARLCVRAISEPARIWLWLAHGERTSSRAQVLERALRRLPGEPALHQALELHRALPRAPDPPADRMLPGLVRFSVRIAALIGRLLEEEERTEVRLAGTGPCELIAPLEAEPGELPLCDWRALVLPRLPDESFARSGADPADPAAVAAAAAAGEGAPYEVLGAEGITIWPSAGGQRIRMRAVQCGATDPVGFALAEGEGSAAFPDVSGWSVADVARRAVAEHRAWLAVEPGARPAPEGRAGALGRLFTAARAALLHETTSAGDPELPVTVTATATALAERSHGSRGPAEDALGAYREWATGGEPPPSKLVAAMSDVVSGLPGYSPG